MNDKPRNGPEPAKPVFGKRGGNSAPSGPPNPSAGEPSQWRLKRSTTIALALMGTGAVAYYLTAREQQCRRDHPDQPQSCRSSSSSNGGSSHSSYSGGSSSSSATSTSGHSSQIVARGGFGGAAHGFFGGG